MSAEPEKSSAMGQDPLAIFTIVQNEPTWLPIWVEHYRKHVDPCDLWVLDHDSTGEGAKTLERLRVETGLNVVPVHRRHSFDHVWLRETVEHFQRFLLQSYRAVLFVESDEIVHPTADAPGRNLTDYANAVLGRREGRREADYVQCTGFEVVHQHATKPEPEAELDWSSRPLLAQRSKWAPSRMYSKTLLSRVPLTWEKGFHTLERKRDRRKAPEPDLLLVHLHKIDFEFCVARHEEVRKRNWDKEALERGEGRQFRIESRDELAAWFVQSIDTRKTMPAELVDIPEALKSIV